MIASQNGRTKESQDVHRQIFSERRRNKLTRKGILCAVS